MFPLSEESTLVLGTQKISLDLLLQIVLQLHHLVPEIFDFVDVVLRIKIKLFVSTRLKFTLYITMQFVAVDLFLAVQLLLFSPGFTVQ